MDLTARRGTGTEGPGVIREKFFSGGIFCPLFVPFERRIVSTKNVGGGFHAIHSR
jgi:hypothetical protein